eukprot:7366278-Pyramimonas_sp.AAC.1
MPTWAAAARGTPQGRTAAALAPCWRPRLALLGGSPTPRCRRKQMSGASALAQPRTSGIRESQCGLSPPTHGS